MPKCSLCGSDGVNKTSCPLNPKSKNPKPELHSTSSIISEMEKLNIKVDKKVEKVDKKVEKVDKGVLLAKEFLNKDGSAVVDPSGWWVSEKFDGYRAIWTGKEFRSRQGHKFNVPKFPYPISIFEYTCDTTLEKW